MRGNAVSAVFLEQLITVTPAFCSGSTIVSKQRRNEA
jgi:hypothetical protein